MTAAQATPAVGCWLPPNPWGRARVVCRAVGCHPPAICPGWAGVNMCVHTAGATALTVLAALWPSTGADPPPHLMLKCCAAGAHLLPAVRAHPLPTCLAPCVHSATPTSQVRNIIKLAAHWASSMQPHGPAATAPQPPKRPAAGCNTHTVVDVSTQHPDATVPIPLACLMPAVWEHLH